jgi:hypothetical protein
MSDKYYSEPDEATALRSWAAWQMLRGVGWAALGVFLVGLLLLVIWGVSHLLPEQSKQAPSPYGALELAQPAGGTV